MSTYETISLFSLIGLGAANIVLIICLLHQRIINGRYKHIITQNIIALKQAEKILAARASANE